jgi:hypothetical protein
MPPSALLGSLDLPLQAFQCYTRSAARKAPTRQIVILNILELTQDRLARVKALAATSFLGQRVETLLDGCGKTKSQHVLRLPICYTCIASKLAKSNGLLWAYFVLAFDKDVSSELVQERYILRRFARIRGQECNSISSLSLLG